MNIVEKNLLTNTLKVWRAELELLERVVSSSMNLLIETEKTVEKVFPDSVVYGTSAYFGNDDKADEDPSAVLYNGEEITPFSEPGSGS